MNEPTVTLPKKLFILEKLDRQIAKRILEKIDSLAENPEFIRGPKRKNL